MHKITNTFDFFKSSASLSVLIISISLLSVILYIFLYYLMLNLISVDGGEVAKIISFLIICSILIFLFAMEMVRQKTTEQKLRKIGKIQFPYLIVSFLAYLFSLFLSFNAYTNMNHKFFGGQLDSDPLIMIGGICTLSTMWMHSTHIKKLN